MKLYYTSGACSLSPHIVALEAGIALPLEKIDGKAKRTENGDDFWQINPKGYVPALRLDDGELLTEGPAIVQYLADRVPEKRLVPPNRTLERTRLQTWLNFASTEIHKGFTPMFNPGLPEDMKELLRAKVRPVLQWLDGELAKRRPYLLGEQFSVADAYLFTVTMPYRCKRAGFDMSPYGAFV